jgi:hypothetical protein
MEDLVKMYNDFVMAIAVAETPALKKLDEHLAQVEEVDWGPGGVVARDMKQHVQFILEDRKWSGRG